MTKAAKILIIIVIALVLIPFALFSFIIVGFETGFISQPTTDNSNFARITDVDHKSVLVDEPGSQGKIIITEVLTFEIHARSDYHLFWELWRDLPEEYVDGVKVDYNVLSVRQVFNDGRPPVVFEESPKLYWYDEDFTGKTEGLGPGKWFHSKGPYDGERNFECVLFYVDGLYRETVHFEVVYEMFNAAMRYGDSSELYYTLYAEETVHYLNSFDAQIMIPLDIMPREGNYYAHTFGTNSNGFPFTESVNKNPGYHTFSFSLDESTLNFKPFNQYIEFALISFGDDKHIFTKHASINWEMHTDVMHLVRANLARYDALPAIFLTAKIIVFAVCLGLALLFLVLTFNTDSRIRKKHTFFKPDMDMEFFRDIPSQLDPLFAAYLVACKHQKKEDTKSCYSAILLDLVRKGYFELEKINGALDWTRNNTQIVIKNRASYQPAYCAACGKQVMGDDKFCAGCGLSITETHNIPSLPPLTKTEEIYMNLVLRHAVLSKISLSALQSKVATDYEYSDFFVTAMKRATNEIGLASPMYFQSTKYKKPKNSLQSKSTLFWILGILLIVGANLISYPTRLELAFGGFFILGIACIICGIYLGKIAKKYILLTQFGETEYAKWRGLYNFLNSETLMKERTFVELVIWEQYLVYATAFGISDKVIKALKLRCPEQQLQSSRMLINPYIRTRGFYSFGRSLGTTTRTASFSYRSGSHGIGGGGGYGGGGRGGGGGGGGH